MFYNIIHYTTETRDVNFRSFYHEIPIYKYNVRILCTLYIGEYITFSANMLSLFIYCAYICSLSQDNQIKLTIYLTLRHRILTNSEIFVLFDHLYAS